MSADFLVKAAESEQADGFPCSMKGRLCVQQAVFLSWLDNRVGEDKELIPQRSHNGTKKVFVSHHLSRLLNLRRLRKFITDTLYLRETECKKETRKSNFQIMYISFPLVFWNSNLHLTLKLSAAMMLLGPQFSARKRWKTPLSPRQMTNLKQSGHFRFISKKRMECGMEQRRNEAAAVHFVVRSEQSVDKAVKSVPVPKTTSCGLRTNG